MKKKIEKKVKKKLKITRVVTLLIIIIIIGFMIGSKKGSTVKMNQNLKIKEASFDYNFSVKVNSIENNQKIVSDTFTKINLTMTVNNGDIPNPLLYTYDLLDSKGNVLASSSSIDSLTTLIYSGLDNNNLFSESNLESNKSTTGDMYFKTDSNDIKKLRIGVYNKGLESKETDKTYYFIKLK